MDLVGLVNEQMRGWAEYHQGGRPARCFWKINAFVKNRLYKHMRRRSQRPYRLPDGMNWWQHLTKDLGFVPLKADPAKALL
jgi:RNA-directed DNA polymerase